MSLSTLPVSCIYCGASQGADPSLDLGPRAYPPRDWEKSRGDKEEINCTLLVNLCRTIVVVINFSTLADGPVSCPICCMHLIDFYPYVSLSDIMVVAIPKLELMISLIGSLASSMLAFVLPSVLEVVHLWPERNSISWFWLTILTKHTVIILIGLISFLGGSVATMMQLIEAFGKPENPS